MLNFEKVLRVSVVTLSIGILGGCGGSAGGDTGTSPVGLKVATFIDSAVSGVDFDGPNYSGTTDGNGNFYYRAGDHVTLKIGDLVLGRVVPTGDKVTPIDLVPGANSSADPRVVRILRTLQSLDSDGDPETNAITITAESRRRLRIGSPLDLSSATTTDNDVSGRLPQGFTRSEAEAKLHFERHRGDASRASRGYGGKTVVTQAANTMGRLLASNCFQCHGTGGYGGFDRIRGGEADEVLEYLTQSGPSNIMAAHAQGYTRAQLLTIIQYLQQ
ncbi:MAG: cytochrome c [Limnohabitans sp.]|nr:cytochrome c [Limnohabitans sp.]